MLIIAAKRLKASRADQVKAQTFLQDMGFTGLSLKGDSENRVSFHFESYNESGLDGLLGKSKPVDNYLSWKFGTNGMIVVKPRSNIVVLKNSDKPAKLHTVEPTREKPKRQKIVDVPVEPKAPGTLRIPKALLERQQHSPSGPAKPFIPVPTIHDENTFVNVPGLPPKITFQPRQTPDLPGSHMNDDTKVPHVGIPDRLKQEYMYAQNMDDSGYRIKFMKQLWTHLNTAKFHGALPAPRAIQLMPNVQAKKLRTRGRWFPSPRVLEMAPRTFNAHLDFFVEIFLHEMCHQAVTDIDKSFSMEEAGHGAEWKAWMVKVGLNPRRFDPNPNETYMSKKELKNDPAGLLRKRAQSYEDIPLKSGVQVTYVYSGRLRNGCTMGLVNKSGIDYWCMFDEDNVMSHSWALVKPQNIFPYQGNKSMQSYDTTYRESLYMAQESIGLALITKPTII
jgi:hypothetical protein